MGLRLMAFVSVLALSGILAMAVSDDKDVNRIGEGISRCSTESVYIGQGLATLSSGTYSVWILNVCTTGCSVSNIHVRCGSFSSATFIDPKVFRRINANDCLVNDGAVLPSGDGVKFYYSNPTPYPLSVSSLTCGN